MKIGIDLRAIGQDKHSGVEEYALNLLDAIISADKKNQYIFFISGKKIGQRFFYFFLKMKNKNANIRLAHFPMPNRLLNILIKSFNWLKIDNLMGGVDAVFAPNINLLPISKGIKIIATIHDLSFTKYKEFFSFRHNFWHSFVNPKLLVNKADHLIAVSESTKQDLEEIYGIPSKKIKVIYSGMKPVLVCEKNQTKEQEKLKKIGKKYNLPEKYILYLGTIEPRKNIIGLIKAFELFSAETHAFNIKYKLVIAGSKGWLYDDIFRAARNSKAKNDIVFTGFVADEDKSCLYQLASLFVYPSFYEGFGFPPLEAMAIGVPVITSDCSSLPEVVGEAGLMINPYNISRLAWAMNEVLSSEALQRKMVAKGHEQVKKFFWNRCAKETLNLLEQ